MATKTKVLTKPVELTCLLGGDHYFVDFFNSSHLGHYYGVLVCNRCGMTIKVNKVESDAG